MDSHITDALSRPALIRLEDGLLCVRFESMKVVSALAAVRRLLASGTVEVGDTLVDSSSGIYAYALALACHRYGLKCRIVASTAVDRTLLTQLEILGVEVDRMPSTTSLRLDQDRRISRVHRILRDNHRHHWMRQYHDDIHYEGYRAVAEALRKRMASDRLTILGGVGTGASTGALGHHLRQVVRDVALVGIQPFGSVTFGGEHVDDPDVIIAGIGSSIPFANVVHAAYDTVHWVGFDAARSGSVELLRRSAIFAGLSTGAAYLAARWERGLHPDREFAFLAPDTGHRYVNAVYARHRTTTPVEQLEPHLIDHQSQLALPWSRMSWDGAPAPVNAVYRPSAVEDVLHTSRD
ncbi:pyridoxal-phosphate dependent enzyme [Saccharothrix sp. SC076]|nr:pyridoxal-phosphate dependent enzyme [Saccharothrix obliqua]